MSASPRQSGPELSAYAGWSPGTYGFRGGKLTTMLRFSAGSPSAPKDSPIIGVDRASPSSRQG